MAASHPVHATVPKRVRASSAVMVFTGAARSAASVHAWAYTPGCARWRPRCGCGRRGPTPTVLPGTSPRRWGCGGWVPGPGEHRGSGAAGRPSPTCCTRPARRRRLRSSGRGGRLCGIPTVRCRAGLVGGGAVTVRGGSAAPAGPAGRACTAGWHLLRSGWWAGGSGRRVRRDGRGACGCGADGPTHAAAFRPAAGVWVWAAWRSSTPPARQPAGSVQ